MKIKRILGTTFVLLTCGVALLALVSIRGLTGLAQGDSTVSDDGERTLSYDGFKRRYLVHLPPNYDGREPLPVVLALHGGGGRAESQRKQSQMNAEADKRGYIVVYPDGTGRLKLLTWNAGSCCGYAVKKNVDDVGYINALIDELARNYSIDQKRVYATGLSNGGMMCYRLACELSNRIAAIAPVAADLGVDGPRPKRQVPILHIHGLRDNNVVFEGGVGSNQYQPVPHRSIADTLGFFLTAYGFQQQPLEVVQGKDYIFERYGPQPGQPGVPILLYKLPEGGHNWPGGVDTTGERFNTGKMIETFPASTVILDFFDQFTLDGPVAPPE